MKNTLNFLKRLAALCLFVTFFLPLSQCSTQKEPPSESSQQTVTTSTTSEVKYAYNADRDQAMFRAINTFAFIWPLLFTCVILVYRRLDEVFAVQVTNIALCLVSAFCLARLTMFGELLLGGYLAWTSLFIYLFISLTQFFQRVRRVWHLASS